MGDIEVFQGDYRELEIPKKEKCVIYCDPPYINTEGYFTNFSHEEFYDWAKQQKIVTYRNTGCPVILNVWII